MKRTYQLFRKRAKEAFASLTPTEQVPYKKLARDQIARYNTKFFALVSYNIMFDYCCLQARYGKGSFS
jgi:hypothetical protein